MAGRYNIRKIQSLSLATTNNGEQQNALSIHRIS